MDKFQTELLAQFKEHNRLIKELVKIERANFELSKDINKVNSRLVDIVIPQNPNTDTLGTYCGVNTSTEIFSAVKPKPAHWISSVSTSVDGKTKYYVCSSCGWSILWSDKMCWAYCPNCGIQMQIEKEGEEDA